MRQHGEVDYHLTRLLTGHGCFQRKFYLTTLPNLVLESKNEVEIPSYPRAPSDQSLVSKLVASPTEFRRASETRSNSERLHEELEAVPPAAHIDCRFFEKRVPSVSSQARNTNIYCYAWGCRRCRNLLHKQSRNDSSTTDIESWNSG